MNHKKTQSSSQTLSELNPEVRPFVEKIIANWKPISIVIVVLLLIILGFFGYRLYEQHKLKQDRNLLSSILEKKDVQKRITGLKKALDEVSNNYKPAIYMNLAILYFQQKDYANLYSCLEELKKLKVDDNIKIIATLIQAKALFLQNKTKEALLLVKGLSSTAPKQYIKPILWSTAYYAEEIHDWETAFDAYKKLKELKDTSNKEFLEEKLSFIKEKIKKQKSRG